jgi:hypothetical protein
VKVTVGLFGREFLTFSATLLPDDEPDKPTPVDTPSLADTSLGEQRDPDTRVMGFHVDRRPEARA